MGPSPLVFRRPSESSPLRRAIGLFNLFYLLLFVRRSVAGWRVVAVAGRRVAGVCVCMQLVICCWVLCMYVEMWMWSDM